MSPADDFRLEFAMVGPLVLLICGTCSLVGVSAPIVSLLRHGSRTILVACFGIPGAVMVLAFPMLYIGLSEGTWKAASVKAVLAGAVGCVGLLLIGLATRSAWKPRPGPGQCPKCAYDLKGLGRCPECGWSAIH